MKKLILFILTSFVALGTSAVGIQQYNGVKPVVASLVSENSNIHVDNQRSVVEWVK